jgi:hypothetical protein
MKNIKKIFLAAMFLLPVNSFAAGGSMVGTDAFADVAGLVNVYYQHKLSEKSAAVVSYATLSGSFSGATVDLTSLAISYKSYFNQIGKGGYWKAGVAMLNISVTSGTLSGSGSGTLPTIAAGYEMSMAPNFVLGFEGGLGATTGAGFLGINTAYMF